MCWDREEMSRCHEKPELLNVAPPKMSPAGLLEKAKSLVEKWPCDHAVTTHQINHMRQPARQDEDAPEIAAKVKSVMLGGCAGGLENQECARESGQSPAEPGRSADTNLHPIVFQHLSPPGTFGQPRLNFHTLGQILASLIPFATPTKSRGLLVSTKFC